MAWADCPPREEARAAALRAVEEADRVSARERLDALLVAYSCGMVATPDQVAEMFLLEGVLASFDKDAEGLSEGFQSAAAVSENFWLASLGPVLQDTFVASRAVLLDSGQIAFDPAPDPYVVFVDGKERSTFPVVLNEGLHLVQLGTSNRDVRYADVVSVNARSQVVIDHDLPSLAVAAPVDVTEPVRSRSLTVYGGVGFGLGFGDTLEGQTPAGVQAEGASKVLIPVELGLHGQAQRFWWRGAASVAPVLTGAFLYRDGEGTGHGSRLVGGGHVAAGLAIKRAHLGVLTGPSWPGRWQLRAVGGAALAGPIRVEGRVGANLVTERPVEPSLELVLSFTPGL